MRNQAPGLHLAVNANQSRRIDVNGPVADGTRGGNASQGQWQHLALTFYYHYIIHIFLYSYYNY